MLDAELRADFADALRRALVGHDARARDQLERRDAGQLRQDVLVHAAREEAAVGAVVRKIDEREHGERSDAARRPRRGRAHDRLAPRAEAHHQHDEREAEDRERQPQQDHLERAREDGGIRRALRTLVVGVQPAPEAAARETDAARRDVEEPGQQDGQREAGGQRQDHEPHRARR